ncbi:SAM-dependent methyltransferase [Catelliglobosispora koreensis]|uniref:SAM-dependent methyltransferase n=1 Tax=Catelliglobosispora koreensis TaxID=129052 RepID=UPI0003818820|nr:methyltransferase domain-containing protein [Catelliglobosispora koreensis]
MTSESVAHTERVRRYYDRNSAAFERLGQGQASIHRAVWGPGVTNRQQAFHYVDKLLLETLSPGASVVDLGCGLGASLLYLASRIDMTGEGLTLSPKQAQRAAELASETENVRCREGDYLAVPADLYASADLTFSIEAFLHSPDADGYFREASRTLRPDGKLVICDDFLTAAGAQNTGQKLLQDFRTGWEVGSLLTVVQVSALAEKHGLTLVRDLDLTPHLELRRPRDRWITAVVTLGRVFRPQGEYWRSLLGGDALQRALVRGLLNYRFLEFKRA